jgi:hypothetical protein
MAKQKQRMNRRVAPLRRKPVPGPRSSEALARDVRRLERTEREERDRRRQEELERLRKTAPHD